MPVLKSSSPSRIVNVASKAHESAGRYNYDTLKQESSALFNMKDYQDSKFANVLHAKKLSQQFQGTGVTVYSLHPGTSST